MGSDLTHFSQVVYDFLFQSTRPVWGATGLGYARFDDAIFQSTLLVWGATHERQGKTLPLFISIHAPRVGSDLKANLYCADYYISIHAPRVGSDSGNSQ